MVVDGLLAFVEVNYLFLLRRDERNILPGFFGHTLVIDPDVGERVVEEAFVDVAPFATAQASTVAGASNANGSVYLTLVSLVFPASA